jgi:hypothetical protein
MSGGSRPSSPSPNGGPSPAAPPPASRFWHFQYIEGSWLLALPILLAAATIWLIRHRAT